MSQKIYSSNKPKVDFNDFIKNFEILNGEHNGDYLFSGENIGNERNTNNGKNYFSKKNRISRFIDKKFIKEYKNNNYENINKQNEKTDNFYLNNNPIKRELNHKTNHINIYDDKDPFTFSYRLVDQNFNNNYNITHDFDEYKTNVKDDKELSKNNIIFANQTLYGDKENFRPKENDNKIFEDKFDCQNINQQTITQDQQKEKLKKQSEEILASLSFERFIKKSHSLSSLIASPKNYEDTNQKEDFKNNFKTYQTNACNYNFNLNKYEKYEKNTSKKLKKKKNKTLDDVREIPRSDVNKNKINIINTDKRQIEVKEQMNDKKFENFETEEKNYKKREKSKISYKSKKVTDNYSKLGKNSVFERLTDNNQFLRKIEEIKILDDIYNKHPCSFEPEINEVSKIQKRDVNDLYNWMKSNETKRLRKEIEANKNIHLKILPNSEEILKGVNPDYLQKKVEDRLIEKGNL